MKFILLTTQLLLKRTAAAKQIKGSARGQEKQTKVFLCSALCSFWGDSVLDAYLNPVIKPFAYTVSSYTPHSSRSDDTDCLCMHSF